MFLAFAENVSGVIQRTTFRGRTSHAIVIQLSRLRIFVPMTRTGLTSAYAPTIRETPYFVVCHIASVLVL